LLASDPELLEERPFVATTVARHLLSRLRVTHQERGISVFSGPWGIGKTTAINAFAAEKFGSCVIVKVEPRGKKGASPVSVMKQAVEELSPLIRAGSKDRRLARTGRAATRDSHWHLRLNIYNLLSEWEPLIEYRREVEYAEELEVAVSVEQPRFTFIFDEAQYLSREAIEMLRYWNDTDRTTTPIPVGIIFIGNNEFSLEEDSAGQSVISGAVRSRAFFIEPLDYGDITDQDLVLFAQSRGVTDAGAIAEIVRYYSSPRISRDLRHVERILATLSRRSNGAPVTAATVHEFFPFT
jgi:DNA transposition AAA+ family ATPase